MIRLAGSSNSYETTISHTGSDSGTIHTINHNLGTVRVDATVQYTLSGAKAKLGTYWYFNGESYGHYIRSITTTSLALYIYLGYIPT